MKEMVSSIVNRGVPIERARETAAPMRIRAAAAAACLAVFAALPAAGDVVAGSDLLTTLGAGQTLVDFGVDPIPMDFFGPGSDALTSQVPLEDVPLVDLPLGTAQGADTIIERLQTAVLASCPSEDTIDIEIVALHLRSIEPVTVTFDGGNGACNGLGDPNPCCTGPGTGDCETEWQLDATLSPMIAQPTGSMTIRQDCPEGGSFSTDPLLVTPRLMFTRISGTLGTSPAILDPAPQIDFSADGFWAHTDGVEGIYRDADSSFSVSAGDTRLSLPGLAVVGSAVAAGELDIGTLLIAFGAAEKHVDPIVNAAYDAGEGVYNDVDISGAVSVGDTRLSVPGFLAGSVVAGGDPDIAAALVAFTVAERHGDPDSSASYDAGEGVYNDADSSGAASLGDSRLMLSAPGFPVGSLVATGNGDIGTGLVPFVIEDPSLCTAVGDPFLCCTGVGTHDGTCTREMHTELTASGVYNTIEGIYDDVDVSDTVSVGDIRLSVPGLPAGSVVSALHGDVEIDLVAFAETEKHTDLTVVNGTYDAGEDIYTDADTNMTVSIGDTRLSGPGFPFGSVVAAGNRDVATSLVAFNLLEKHTDPNSNAAYDPGEGVYSDADASGAVSGGDIRITVAGSSVLGSVVAATDGDVGVALVPFAVAERHADPDGNGMYDSGLGLLTSPGGTVDGDGDNLIDETFPATSNFTTGAQPLSCTCGAGRASIIIIPAETCHEGPTPSHQHCTVPPPPPFDPPPDDPLAVTLTTFSAEASRGRVTLSWSTAAEIDNEGFNILRSTEPRQPGKAVNSSLIPAEGGPAFGAAYELIDDSVQPGMTYYYLLEDISTSGQRTLHGAGACTLDGVSKCEAIKVSIPDSTGIRTRSRR